MLAAREAMVNAAKHSGADKVDVFAECHERRVEVFVRDRGHGFDQGAVPQDRLGIRNSIVDRMVRHGGQAEIRTSPGEGTEVRLSMTGDRHDHPAPPAAGRGHLMSPAVPSPSPGVRRSVVVVDDHAMFRRGVRAEIEGHVEVLAEAEDVDEAVDAVLRLRPEVVLLDVHLPGGGGGEVMRRRR